MPSGALARRRLTGRRAVLEWALVGVLSALVVIAMINGRLAERADFLVYDSLIRLTANEASEEIVIVAIDDRSLAQIGRWPWPRERHTELVRQLARAEPRAVLYDVLFVEPDPADGDLARAIQAAGNVHLPVLIDTPGANGAPWEVRLPASGLATAAAGLGHVTLSIDSDGSIRRVPLQVQTGTQTWPHLVLSLAPSPPRAVQVPAGEDQAMLALEEQAIAYGRVPGHYRTVSFVDVIRGEVPTDFLRDRIVLVGATAAGLGDRYATPSSPQGQLVPGVEIQASLLQTLMEDSGPVPVAQITRLALSLLPLLILLAGFLYLRPLSNMVLGLILMGLVLLTSTLLFLMGGLWFAPVPALAGLMVAYPLWSWRRLATASAYMQAELEVFERETAQRPQVLNALPLATEAGDVVARQVNALRVALRRLRDFDLFIQDSLRSLPDPTLVTDPEGRILLSNARADALLGDLVRPGSLVDPLFQSLGEPAWRRLLGAPESEAPDLRTAGGQILLPAATRLSDSTGATTGIIVRLADVTQIRAAERQREHAIQLLTHDMRAPQVSILTLLDTPAGQRTADADRRIAICARQTLDLAEGYVLLARAETLAFNASVVDMVQTAIEAADLLWPQAQARGVTIRVPGGRACQRRRWSGCSCPLARAVARRPASAWAWPLSARWPSATRDRSIMRRGIRGPSLS